MPRNRKTKGKAKSRFKTPSRRNSRIRARLTKEFEGLTEEEKAQVAKAAKAPHNPLPLRPSLLLHPVIPKPLFGMAPRIVLGATWWNEVRTQAYESTDYHCLACGVHRSKAIIKPLIEAHETYDIDFLLGRMTYVETVPLCHACHSYIHQGRLRYLLSERLITPQRYSTIIQHGDRILREKGLRRQENRSNDPTVGDDEWRLVIDGKEYDPKDYRGQTKKDGDSK